MFQGGGVKKKAVETVENKKHVSHRFHSTATTAVINFEEFIFSKVRNLTDATNYGQHPCCPQFPQHDDDYSYLFQEIF